MQQNHIEKQLYVCVCRLGLGILVLWMVRKLKINLRKKHFHSANGRTIECTFPLRWSYQPNDIYPTVIEPNQTDYVPMPIYR